MKKSVLILLCFIFLFSCKNALQEGIEERTRNKYDDGWHTSGYIIKTLKGFDIEAIDGIKAISKLDLSDYDYFLVKIISKDASVSSLKEHIEANKNVVYMEKNYTLQCPEVLRDKIAHPFFKSYGDEDFSGEELYEQYGYALEAIKAKDYIDEDGIKQKGAYNSEGYGNNEVVVAIIDSGFNMNHKDFYKDGKSICLYAKSAFEKEIRHISENYYDQYQLEGKKLRELEIPSNEDIGDSDIFAECGHGTHCTGSICATAGNGNVMGVAWKNTKVISYKAFSIYNYHVTDFAVYGSLGDLADIVAILRKEPSSRTSEEKNKIPASVDANFRITQKTVPLNMSIGGPIGSAFEVEMLNKAIAVGILPVIAMGNDGRTRSVFPVATYGCLGVGATDRYDKRAFFSNSGSWISVTAPGVGIVSTLNGHWEFPKWEALQDSDKDGMSLMSGTSMAAPCVTGLISYLLSFDEGHHLTTYQIKRLLEITADKVDKGNFPYGAYNSEGYSEYYGYGRINALKAIKVLKGNSSIELPQPDSFYIEAPCTIKTPNSNTKVFLYEKNDMRCTGIGRTSSESKEIKFYGLKKGQTYIVRALLSKNKVLDWEFSATRDKVMEHQF